MTKAGVPSEKEDSTGYRAATQRRRKTSLSVEVLLGVAGASLQLVVVDRTQEEHAGTWVSGSPGHSQINAKIVGEHLPSLQGDLGLMRPHGWPQRGSGFVVLLQLLTSGSQQNPSLLLLSCFSSSHKWHFLCPQLVFSTWPAQHSQVARPPLIHRVATSVRGISWVLLPGTFSLLPHLQTAPDISTDAPPAWVSWSLGLPAFHPPLSLCKRELWGNRQGTAPAESHPSRELCFSVLGFVVAMEDKTQG